MAPRLFAQTWRWIEKPWILNPSNIELMDNVTTFQVLDWNQDSLWDLILNNNGKFELFIQQPVSNQFDKESSIEFPKIGWNYPSIYSDYKLPKNFEYIDWDSDGDFDLVADSSFFWRNSGTNSNPLWSKDNSILSNAPMGKDLSFADLDDDADWDLILQERFSGGTFVYRNNQDNINPEWQLIDTLEINNYDRGFGYEFVNLDNDSLIDLASISFIPADPGSHLSLVFWRNEGSTTAPKWQEVEGISFFWSSFIGGQPAYDVFDFDGDNHFDLIKNDWMRHLSLYLNRSQNTTPVFQDTADFVYGAINGESNTRPYFFDVDGDRLQDLILSEDFWTFFLFGSRFQEGRSRVFQNLTGRFETTAMLEKNAPKPFQSDDYPTFQKGITISFADVDRDEDTDFIASFTNVDSKNALRFTGLLYFENTGSNSEQQWQPDSTRFVYFLEPDSMFYDPHLVDIDNDNDFDLFLQKGGEYRFYERLNTPEENWKRNTTWGTGIENRNYYSATFSDLTLDGKPDLVFGLTNGTLIMYENIGSKSKPEWQLIEDVFSSIQVDSLAVPAFSDINGDGQQDLVIGNADGRLFYLENASIVDAVHESKRTPEGFQLTQNYPNPFNPSTTIRFSIPTKSSIKITIYNTLGQRIKVLADGQYLTGEYSVRWDGRNEVNQLVSSGVYFYELSTNKQSLFRKLIFLK